MTVTGLGDYIKIYPRAISEEFCWGLLNLAESAPNSLIDLSWRKCMQVGFGEEHPALFKPYISEMKELVLKYEEEVKVGTLQNISRIERPNVFRYAPKKDNHFHLHADAWNGESATRQLSIIVYLNDVEEGGETRFVKYGINVKPRARQALVFPSSWQFEHQAMPPVSGEKLILVSWLHFGPKTDYYTYPI